MVDDFLIYIHFNHFFSQKKCSKIIYNILWITRRLMKLLYINKIHNECTLFLFTIHVFVNFVQNNHQLFCPMIYRFENYIFPSKKIFSNQLLNPAVVVFVSRVLTQYNAVTSCDQVYNVWNCLSLQFYVKKDFWKISCRCVFYQTGRITIA